MDININSTKNAETRYNDFSEYLKKRFKYKVQKISINAGFTCPNRDGSKGRGGCTYCNNTSFTPTYENRSNSISNQLQEGIKFFSNKYPEMKYLAYFQSYTNTYDSIDSLIEKYEQALAYDNVVGLIVGTRPDCMPDDLIDYFEELNKKKFVMIEYGVESTLNKTLEIVNRQHTYEESKEAIIKTARKNIPVGAHLILGLPGETEQDLLSHAKSISKLPLTSIKLHQLQIVKGTKMAKQYEVSPQSFHLYDMEGYIDLCVNFLERLNPELYIDRFTSQTPAELLIAPQWGVKNYIVKEKIIKRLKLRNTWQGKLYI